jgi:hypothetical protein
MREELIYIEIDSAILIAQVKPLIVSFLEVIHNESWRRTGINIYSVFVSNSEGKNN